MLLFGHFTKFFLILIPSVWHIISQSKRSARDVPSVPTVDTRYEHIAVDAIVSRPKNALECHIPHWMIRTPTGAALVIEGVGECVTDNSC